LAIDLRRSRTGKYSRNKYYKGEYVDKMKLIKGAKAQGVFYSSDLEPMTITTIAVGMVKKKQYLIRLLTHDYIPDLTADDFVLYEGTLWLVDSVVFDDLNDNKEFSTRPSYETTIQLRR